MQPDTGGKHILLGIGGGIAAYKTPELVRLLRAAAMRAIPVLTANAQRFVTPMALQAVAGERPRTDLWDAEAESSMGHIELARWADAVLIAPATANLMARLAGGLADDLLTTTCLAATAPVLLAPAMNTVMWQHPATQRNVERLRADGCVLLGPAEGEQACGEFGPGRMMEPAEIVESVRGVLAQSSCLAGLNVLVTAGPTREFLDPVRFISNRSSGRQGFAFAAAARNAGAEVTLVAGPVHLQTPPGIRRIDVVSAAEMKDAVAAHVSAADIFVSVAAVADYRPSHFYEQKLKKSDRESTEMQVALKENADIVGSIAGAERRPFVVGFAAETENALAYARDKRRRKGMDAIVVNDVSKADIGFDSADNAATLIHGSGEVAFPKASKEVLARRLVEEVAALYRTRSTAGAIAERAAGRSR